MVALIIAYRIMAAWHEIIVTIKRNIFTPFYFHKFFVLTKLGKIKQTQKFLILQYITNHATKSSNKFGKILKDAARNAKTSIRMPLKYRTQITQILL